jgi:hypothetical protein
MELVLGSKVIIMANRIAGYGGEKRWNNYLNAPKHLAPINKKPIIHIIQEQLAIHGFKDIGIICQEEDFLAYSLGHAKWLNPQNIKIDKKNPDHEINVCKSFFSLEKPNLILFGDNVYTKKFFSSLLNCNSNSWQYFARPWSSEYVNKPYEEGFAWFIPESKIKILLEATKSASKKMIAHYGKVMPGTAVRESYEIAELWSTDLDKHLVVIDDETTDFDYPEEFDFWINKFESSAKEILF